MEHPPGGVGYPPLGIRISRAPVPARESARAIAVVGVRVTAPAAAPKKRVSKEVVWREARELVRQGGGSTAYGEVNLDDGGSGAT